MRTRRILLVTTFLAGVFPGLFLADTATASKKKAPKNDTSETETQSPAVNACGCFRESDGSCKCLKKSKCGCPDDCEPAGCEEKRQKEMEREVQEEIKRQKDRQEKNDADFKRRVEEQERAEEEAKDKKKKR